MTVARNETFKYAQVSRYINELIEKGNLKPGDKAPSLRKLSKQLGVSIATVTQSYVHLEDQGVLTARPQSGFYVNDLATQINDIDKSASGPRQARRVRFGGLFEEAGPQIVETAMLPDRLAIEAVQGLEVIGPHLGGGNEDEVIDALLGPPTLLANLFALA